MGRSCEGCSRLSQTLEYIWPVREAPHTNARTQEVSEKLRELGRSLSYYKRGQQRSLRRLIDLLRPVNTFSQLTKSQFVHILPMYDSSDIRYLLESLICSMTLLFYGILTR